MKYIVSETKLLYLANVAQPDVVWKAAEFLEAEKFF